MSEFNRNPLLLYKYRGKVLVNEQDLKKAVEFIEGTDKYKYSNADFAWLHRLVEYVGKHLPGKCPGLKFCEDCGSLFDELVAALIDEVTYIRSLGEDPSERTLEVLERIQAAGGLGVL